LTPTLKKLLLILSDGQFHSGEQLGKTLGLTRSAVWKLTKKLLEWDLEIESISNKGYRIPGGVSLLDKEKILSYLTKKQKSELAQFDLLDTVPSTNDYLFNLPASSKRRKKAFVCLAEKQTQGKGRHGRAWASPFAQNIYLSLLWHFPKDPGELSGLSLAIAISVIETLYAFGITQKLGIKWPNDILYNNQKLAGILIELSGEAHDTCKAVIGIGLNVHMTNKHQKAITQPWTDLQTLTNKAINRNELTGLLLNKTLSALRLFQEQGLKAFFKQWRALDLAFKKPVSIINATTSYQGVGKGINEQGYFLLALKPGLIKSFPSGDLSLRFL
jgi:BirA family biotin operon repressor/biotin-[acetyl-CoA-carboxylase] ligase